jgi:hypothetical protein
MSALETWQPVAAATSSAWHQGLSLALCAGCGATADGTEGAGTAAAGASGGTSAISGGMRVGAMFKPVGGFNAIFHQRLGRRGRAGRRPTAWRNVAAGDPLMAGGNGTDVAQRLTFGACPGGDVVAYRFKDEGHVADFEKHFNPRVRAGNIAGTSSRDARATPELSRAPGARASRATDRPIRA